MEKMLDLFDQEPEIKDAIHARELVISGGSIVFDKVSFSYDQKIKALDEMS